MEIEQAASDIIVRLAEAGDVKFVPELCEAYQASAKARGIGIAQRSAEYLEKKMLTGRAVIAVSADGSRFAGFCYIESWGHERFVVNSGLTVLPEFRECGLARRIKEMVFDLSRALYPNAKIFGLTTSSAVMKLNSQLGYRPVTYGELTDDKQFWDGCRSCVNFEAILVAKGFKNCLCTGMLFDPNEQRRTPRKSGENEGGLRLVPGLAGPGLENPGLAQETIPVVPESLPEAAKSLPEAARSANGMLR